MRKLIFESFLEKQGGCSQTMHTTIGNNKIGPLVSLLHALLSKRQTHWFVLVTCTSTPEVY